MPGIQQRLGEMDRGVGVAAADPPDAVRTDALDRHEADLARLVGPGNIVDPDPGGELDARALEPVGRRAAEIVLVATLELLHGPDARRVHRKQQILVGLQVERSRARRAGDEIRDLRLLRVAHIERGDAVAEAVTDVGVAAMHHDLHAVAVPAHIGMADEPDAFGDDRGHPERAALAPAILPNTEPLVRPEPPG
jgi:hypothetical protein